MPVGRRTLGIIGVFGAAGSHAHDKLAKVGQLAFDFASLGSKAKNRYWTVQRQSLQRRRLMDFIHHKRQILP